jgi:HEAT repeat protein
MSQSTPTAPVEEEDLPTPASTVAKLIGDVSSEDPGVRLVSIYALGNFGDAAVPAIPALIANLYYEENFEVRKAAAEVLGKLGPLAESALPDLITVLRNRDEYFHARVAAAESLGKINDPGAVPALADALYYEGLSGSDGIAITSAKSIARITGEQFRDVDSLGYALDENGIPLIVLDARNWWQEVGQFQEWGSK